MQLGIEDLDLILKERRLRWYGHVERTSGAVKTAFDIQTDGKRGPGRPKMTWKQLTVRDCREWKLLAINPHDRCTGRSGVRSAMRAASQLSGRGPIDMDVNFFLYNKRKQNTNSVFSIIYFITFHCLHGIILTCFIVVYKYIHNFPITSIAYSLTLYKLSVCLSMHLLKKKWERFDVGPF